jgi:hypothetical protein
VRALAALATLAVLASCTPHHCKLIDGAAQGDLAHEVQVQSEASALDGRRVLVYVGAVWCEPCQRFHEAAHKGELDGVLGNVDLLVYDLDRDGARLQGAGFGSQMIPLLVVPDGTGRGTAKRMQGSIKGPGAVAEMTPRLQALLAP